MRCGAWVARCRFGERMSELPDPAGDPAVSSDNESYASSSTSNPLSSRQRSGPAVGGPPPSNTLHQPKAALQKHPGPTQGRKPIPQGPSLRPQSSSTPATAVCPTSYSAIPPAATRQGPTFSLGRRSRLWPSRRRPRSVLTPPCLPRPKTCWARSLIRRGSHLVS